MRKYLALGLLLLSLGLTLKQLYSEMVQVRSLKQDLVTTQKANTDLRQGYETRLASMQAALSQREQDVALLAKQNTRMKGTLHEIATSNPDWSRTPVPDDVVKRMCVIVSCSNERP